MTEFATNLVGRLAVLSGEGFQDASIDQEAIRATPSEIVCVWLRNLNVVCVLYHVGQGFWCASVDALKLVTLEQEVVTSPLSLQERALARGGQREQAIQNLYKRVDEIELADAVRYVDAYLKGM